jgi:RecB family exonuclease
MLRLKTAPERPENRLKTNYLLHGNIAHDVLKIAYTEPERMESVFEEIFAAAMAKERIAEGYHTERIRNAIREDLLAFFADDTWPRERFQTHNEEPFVFAIDPSLEISGRIDRIDREEDGAAYVIDYKYSAAQGTKKRLEDVNLLQAPLYYLAAQEKFGVQPDGVFYVGLKKEIVYVGWSHSGFLKSVPIPADWLERTRARTLQAAGEIRAGRVEVKPANAGNCRFCDCRDVCRVGVDRGEALAAGEDGE